MNGRRPGLAEAISPELVALALVVVLGGSLLLGVTVGGAGLGAEGSRATPTAVPETLAPTPSRSPAVDQADVSLAISVNDSLSASGANLSTLLAAPTLDGPALVTAIREIAATARYGTAVADRLRQRSGSAAVGASLAGLYGDLLGAAAVASSTLLTDTVTLTAIARQIVVRLGDVPAATGELTALLAPASAPTSGPPSESPSPTGSAPGPTPSGETPGPSATPETSPAPTPSPTPPPGPGPNQLAAAGFESGVGLPWELHLEASDAMATLVADTSTAEEGTTSARIDISAGSSSRAGVSLRQGNISLVPGERYIFRVALRATVPREVGLRVVSTGGDTYSTRIFTVGNEWMIATFEFTAVVSDTSAYWEIDVGRSNTTVWVDDAWLGEAAIPLAS